MGGRTGARRAPRVVSLVAVTALATALGLGAGAVPASAHDDETTSGAEHAREDLAGVSMSTIEEDTAAAAARRTPQEKQSMARGMRRAEGQAASASAATRGTTGAWSSVVTTPLVPVFTAVLPDGKVLMWDSVGDGAVEDYPGPQDFTRAIVFDPATNTSVDVRLEGYNIFCAGYTQLPNGDVLVVGGNKNDRTDPIRQTHVFHWRTQTWTRGPDMAGERWYPSVAALADGEAVIVGGGAGNPEVYQGDGTLRTLHDVDVETTTVQGQKLSDRKYYPMLLPRQDGRVQLLGPGPLATIDPAGAGSIDATADRDQILRSYGSFGSYAPGKTLVAGGGDLVTGRDASGADVHEPTDTALVVDTAGGTTTVRPTAPMAFHRRQHNLTVLADGSALVTGGMSRSKDLNVDLDRPVLAAERWDPATEDWTTLAAASRIREYHSSATLLPDGRVLTGGGGICEDCVLTGYLEKNVEYFSPPYLFDADGSPAARPVLQDAPGAVTVGDTFTATSPQAGSIRSLSLVKLGAATHSTDQGQRYVPLDFTASGDTLTAQAPATATEAPPGYYMLFAVDDRGVPSVAATVQVRTDLEPTVELSRGRPATQSSTFSEADGSVTGDASHAVDGVTDGNYRSGKNSIAHTGLKDAELKQPWWQVDLQRTATVQDVELWNRTDCCRDRLVGTVFLSDSDMTGRTYDQLRQDPGVAELPFDASSSAFQVLAASGTRARFVRVQLSGTNPLALAEVQVRGVAGDARPVRSNTAPVAVAGAPSSARGTRGVTLDGSGSSDLEGDPLTYRWRQVGGPAVRLVGPTTARPTFVAPARGGTLRFELRVNDGLRDSPAVTTQVAVEPRVDLALRRAARQSTTSGGGKAARAVDGRTDGRWKRGSVTRTRVQKQPWWQVDLGAVADVDTVRTFNRTDCCGAQLRGALVLLSERSMTGRSLAALRRDPRVVERRISGAGASATLRGRVPARFVRVQSPRRTSLALAEVQVFGWRR